MSRKPIVITGARGRLAQALIPAIEAHCGQVVRVSRTGDSECLSYEDAFDGDVFASASAIVHCAWSTVPSLSESHPGLEWRNDLPLLSRLLGSLAGIEAKPRFIFMSSAGTVYGNAEDEPSFEDSPLNPIGWYGRGKVAAEMLCDSFGQTLGIPLLNLRVTNPYGMSARAHRPQGIVAAARRAMEAGESLPVWGDGSAEKDYLHIDDFCEAMVTAINLGLTGCFNICHGESHSVREVIEVIESILGRQVPLEFVPRPPWDVVRSRVSGQKFRRATGWESSISLRDGVARCFEAEEMAR